MGFFRKQHDITDIYGVRRDKPAGDRLPDAPSKRSFNRHYHNYFRGYTEIRRTDEKGRVKIERYYTHPWMVSGLSAGKYWLLRALYALLTAAAVVLYIVSLTRNIPATRSWIVALPGLPASVVLFLLAMAVIQYAFVPRRMTQWDHLSSTRSVKRAALATAIILAVAALTAVVFLLIDGREAAGTLLCALGLLAGAGCGFVMYWIERKVPYREIPNDTKLPEGEAHEIR